MKELKADKTLIKILSTRDELGAEAARDASRTIQELLKENAEINIIFAAAPSQNEFLEKLCEDKACLLYTSRCV